MMWADRPGRGAGAEAEQCVLAVTAAFSLFFTSHSCWQLLSADCLASAPRTQPSRTPPPAVQEHLLSVASVKIGFIYTKL